MMKQRYTKSTVAAWRPLATVVLAAGLAACSGLPVSVPQKASPVAAQRLAERGAHQDAAGMYLRLAGEQNADARSRYLLLAAQQYIAAGDRQRATAALSQVEPQGQQPLSNDWQITSAALRVMSGDGAGALEQLAAADPTRFSLNQRIAAERVRGEALFLEDQPLPALTTFQRRALWLNSGEEITDNQQRIWDGLLQSSPEALRAAQAETKDPILRGWLALGLLADGTLPGGPVSGVAGWQRQFPNHPALRSIIPGLTGSDAGEAHGMPQRIAVLLTLSGRSAVVGEAVRDGLLSHYSEQFAGEVDAPEIRIYDIAVDGATLTYQRAVAEGADFVIGPLLPSPVQELAVGNAFTVPTLLLNYLPADSVMPVSVFQFGLAPEHEAAAAARRAYTEGHRRAVALVPASNWGERVLQAFDNEFTALGGELLDYQSYLASESDYADEIQTMMLLNDSVARYRSLRSLLGGTLQFEPRRRADVDFIFMGANAASGRRIKPQLRFHYAGDLPVYATSSVYAIDTSDFGSDLDGVRFGDIPWLTARMRGDVTPLSIASNYLASARTQPRLFALGYDTLDVLRLIRGDTASSDGERVSGATGTLRVDFDGRIQREPSWAVFERDRPRALPTLEYAPTGADTSPPTDPDEEKSLLEYF